MKRITAITITLALALTLASCGGGNADPAETGTTTATTAETAVDETVTTAAETEEETETVASEPQPDLPEFDLSSEECLMYRLMDMTYEEIEAEFGDEYDIMSGSIETGDMFLQLYLDEKTNIQITFSRKYHYVDDSEWNWEEVVRTVVPSYVSFTSDSLSIYPGINVSMTTEDIVKVIPEWYNTAMSQINKINTYANVKGYCLCVHWTITDNEFVGELKNETENKDWKENLDIMQRYANEFMNNMGKYSATVSSVSLYDENYLKKLNYLGFN